MFFVFVLNDNKASKVFKLAQYDDKEGEANDNNATWLSVMFNQREKGNNNNNNNDNLSSNSSSDTHGHAKIARNHNDIADHIKATALTCV